MLRKCCENCLYKPFETCWCGVLLRLLSLCGMTSTLRMRDRPVRRIHNERGGGLKKKYM